MLIVGGVVVVVVVAIVLVLSSGGGGKSTAQETAKTSTTGGSHTRKRGSSHHGESTTAASPASTAVVVLNGTETTGLAHSLSDNLQQSGYLRSKALDGSPPGSHTTTVVEYTSGHRADAQGVANALNIARVQPMESGVASLAGAATVVVVAGEDKAATVSESAEGGASSATGQ
jgi:LytR cell envelope-related transcriptional attenuator